MMGRWGIGSSDSVRHLHGLKLRTGNLQEAFRIPENRFKILHGILHYPDAFFAQEVRHHGSALKMMFPAQ
jgi:hypothetical protein